MYASHKRPPPMKFCFPFQNLCASSQRPPPIKFCFLFQNVYASPQLPPSYEVLFSSLEFHACAPPERALLPTKFCFLLQNLHASPTCPPPTKFWSSSEFACLPHVPHPPTKFCFFSEFACLPERLPLLQRTRFLLNLSCSLAALGACSLGMLRQGRGVGGGKEGNQFQRCPSESGEERRRRLAGARPQGRRRD